MKSSKDANNKSTLKTCQMEMLKNACKTFKTQLNVEKDGEKFMKLLLESLLRTTNKTNGISI